MATKKDIQVCFNPHFDSVSLWIGSFGGADSPCDISRGVFAARQGVPRILEMMDRYGIKTTWDITGHSICLLYTSPSPRDGLLSRMPSSA